MGWRRQLGAFLQFLSLFTFFCMSVTLFLLPELPALRYRIAHLLFETPEGLWPIAVGLLAFTGLLGWGFSLSNRGEYLEIRMGADRATFRLPLVRKTIRHYLKESFPKEILLEDVEIENGGKLSIGVCLSKRGELFEVLEEKELLESLEGKLKKLLETHFGYVTPFSLLVRSTQKGSPDPSLSGQEQSRAAEKTPS